MRKQRILFFAILTISLSLIIACKSSSQVNDSPAGFVASEEFIQKPTDTLLLATEGASQIPIQLPESGFSFVPVKGYEFITVPIPDSVEMVVYHNEDQTVSIYMFGDTNDERFTSEEDLIIFWMNLLANNDQIALAPVENKEVIVGGYKGMAIDLEGESFNQPAVGQVVAVHVSDLQYFFILGFAACGESESVWQNEGQMMMDNLLAGIEFPE